MRRSKKTTNKQIDWAATKEKSKGEREVGWNLGTLWLPSIRYGNWTSVYMLDWISEEQQREKFQNGREWI